MSTPTELWKKWEGRIVDGKFPLRQWLGGSDHSAVFLTERIGAGSQKAAIKLIPAENLNYEKLDQEKPDQEKLGQENLKQDIQLFRWAAAAKLSHPHLIRLFDFGRCEIDGTRLLYVVMEFADENLAEILPVRALSADEASEMLPPTAQALASLHQAGFVHGRIKPSNIMAANNQLKISADGLCKIGERSGGRASSAYDAPEAATVGLSPPADIWSLGLTLVAVLTQREPGLNSDQKPPAVPESIPQPFRDIARRCLQIEPLRRSTADDILRRLQPQAQQAQVPVDRKPAGRHAPQRGSRRRVAAPIVAAAVILLVVALVVSRYKVHQPSTPAAETNSASPSPPAVLAPAQSPAPFSEKPTQRGIPRGSVLQQVLPDVSRSAQNTIEGRLKVSVQVEVDASGNVAGAKFVSPGPSQYFANRALAASRRWRFNPPLVDGQAAASVWNLRFQFGRTSTQVVPAEIKP